eukprot:scaffold2631_cov412-Prasinococcus_capsulatus_cf.AAC.4
MQQAHFDPTSANRLYAVTDTGDYLGATVVHNQRGNTRGEGNSVLCVVKFIRTPQEREVITSVQTLKGYLITSSAAKVNVFNTTGASKHGPRQVLGTSSISLAESLGLGGYEDGTRPMEVVKVVCSRQHVVVALEHGLITIYESKLPFYIPHWDPQVKHAVLRLNTQPLKGLTIRWSSTDLVKSRCGRDRCSHRGLAVQRIQRRQTTPRELSVSRTRRAWSELRCKRVGRQPARTWRQCRHSFAPPAQWDLFRTRVRPDRTGGALLELPTASAHRAHPVAAPRQLSPLSRSITHGREGYKSGVQASLYTHSQPTGSTLSVVECTGCYGEHTRSQDGGRALEGAWLAERR